MEAGGNDNDHETPPIIPRYEPGPPQLQVSTRRLIRAPVPATTPQIARPYGVQSERKKVLMIRRPDGSTQLLRPVSHRDNVAPRLLQRMPNASVHGNMFGSAQSVRTVTGAPFRTAPPQQNTRALFEDSYISRVDGIYANNRIANMRPQIGYSQRLGGLRRYGFPQTFQSPIRNTVSAREYLPRRNPIDRFSRRLVNRGYQFDLDGNVSEERAIRDAIAREEEKLRQEEEQKSLNNKSGTFSSSVLDFSPVNLSQNSLVEEIGPLFCRNLLPSSDDSSDQRTIKLVLENIINQVCRWDKHYGWFKMHLNRPKYKMARKVYPKHTEVMLSEHLDYLRKEINKRRSQLETQAESSLGILAPWRRARGRPSNKHFAKRPAPYDKEKQRNREQQVVNPADISLGGEAVDWANKDVKEEEHSLKHSSPKGIQQSSSKEESSDDDTQQSKVLMHIPPPLTRSRGRPRKAESEKRRREAEARMKKMVEEGNDVRNMIDPSELHCICRQPFDDRKFYVACSECQQWFHGKCIGLSEKRARRLSRFVCHDCRSPQDEESEMEEAVREAKCGLMEQQGDSDEDEEQEGDVDVDAMSDDQMDRNEQYEQHDVHPKEEELYCLCRTPYDEEKFYVGCDNCTGWYHPECVGITERDAQRSESYICPGCQSGLQQHYDEQQFEHNAPRNSFLWDLFEAVSEHRNAWPFKEAVDVEEFPKYHQVVKNPIDLSIIENKLRNYCYSTHIELHADLQLMLSNAKLFNQKGSTIYQCAEAIEAVIKGKIAEARNRST